MVKVDSLYVTDVKIFKLIFYRYSYFYKLLPLLLTGLSDDMPDINKHSRQLMDQVGKENNHL